MRDERVRRRFWIRPATRHRPETTLLVDEVLPARPLRQWVLSLPRALRLRLATNPAALAKVARR